tara:strand:- start:770 stop:1033 length:264 start_codon:yes stop_codon:yes gene_type:complete
VIAGAAAGGGACLVLLALAAVWWRRRAKLKLAMGGVKLSGPTAAARMNDSSVAVSVDKSAQPVKPPPPSGFADVAASPVQRPKTEYV